MHNETDKFQWSKLLNSAMKWLPPYKSKVRFVGHCAACLLVKGQGHSWMHLWLMGEQYPLSLNTAVGQRLAFHWWALVKGQQHPRDSKLMFLTLGATLCSVWQRYRYIVMHRRTINITEVSANSVRQVWSIFIHATQFVFFHLFSLPL